MMQKKDKRGIRLTKGEQRMIKEMVASLAFVDQPLTERQVLTAAIHCLWQSFYHHQVRPGRELAALGFLLATAPTVIEIKDKK